MCGKPAPKITLSEFNFVHKLFNGPKQHVPAMNRVKSIVSQANLAGRIFPLANAYSGKCVSKSWCHKQFLVWHCYAMLKWGTLVRNSHGTWNCQTLNIYCQRAKILPNLVILFDPFRLGNWSSDLEGTVQRSLDRDVVRLHHDDNFHRTLCHLIHCSGTNIIKRYFAVAYRTTH